jgi:PleD family two-component response regulator
VTVSVGVADLKDYVEEFHNGTVPTNFDCLEMIRLADKRLYEAKAAGRNAVRG